MKVYSVMKGCIGFSGLTRGVQDFHFKKKGARVQVLYGLRARSVQVFSGVF